MHRWCLPTTHLLPEPFYVFIDIGDGPVCMGIYTLIEKVEDQMLATQSP